VDESHGKIEGIMVSTGLTEEEARARYHLGETFEALREVIEIPGVPDADPMDSVYALRVIGPHFDALQNFLARRVLERERPQGWGRGGSMGPETEGDS